jgi:hypothetical protein
MRSQICFPARNGARWRARRTIWLPDVLAPALAEFFQGVGGLDHDGTRTRTRLSSCMAGRWRGRPHLAREGAAVFLAGRAREPLEAVAADLAPAGGSAAVAGLDALDAAPPRV